MKEKIKLFIEGLDLENIGSQRKSRITEIANQFKAHNEIKSILFVCTHNSRRSQLAEIWSHAICAYYNLNYKIYSAGTETTALNPAIIRALEESNFVIQSSQGKNPQVEVHFGDHQSIICYSKLIDNVVKDLGNFHVIMTCDDADQNCPVVPGATTRNALTYEDPKISDGTPGEAGVYFETSRLIATEIKYLFSQLI